MTNPKNISEFKEAMAATAKQFGVEEFLIVGIHPADDQGGVTLLDVATHLASPPTLSTPFLELLGNSIMALVSRSAQQAEPIPTNERVDEIPF